jgi:hypothetical protein
MEQDRRRFALSALVAVAGAAGLGACRGREPAEGDAAGDTGAAAAAAAGPSGGTAVVPATTAVAGPAALPADPAVHAANRLTFGLTPDLVEEIRSTGVAVWVEEQLHPERYPDPPPLRAALDELPTLRLGVDELAELLAADGDGAARPTAVAAETVAATVARQRWSGAQLYELMVEFWTNHFAMNAFSGPLRVLKPIDDRDVIRPHALGRFADLLAASAQSPAMLVSLDNARSKAGAINENYGRELLELHTVGVDGGYGEADVVAVANTLTGFTVQRGTGRFRFDPTRHDDRPQQVMDWRTPPDTDGYSAGLSLLDHLAHHPATARHLAAKLVTRFVSDQPDPGLVERLAQVYLDHDTAIDAVLRALVADERFTSTATAKFRRPHELLLAALRGLDARFGAAALLGGAGGGGGGAGGRRSRGGLGDTMRSLGQLPMSWPSPDGFPDVASAWRNPGALLNRWNALADLVAGSLSPATVELGGLIGTAAGAGDVVDLVAHRLFAGPLAEAERAAVLRGAGVSVTDPVPASGTTAQHLVALVLATPRFQYR